MDNSGLFIARISQLEADKVVLLTALREIAGLTMKATISADGKIKGYRYGPGKSPLDIVRAAIAKAEPKP